MYPHGMPNIPNGRETSPRIPLPPGRADGSADCLSLHTLVHGRLTVGVKRHYGTVTARSEYTHLTCGRVPGGARLHDYWQQASKKRGAAKEVRFPGFRPDGECVGFLFAPHCIASSSRLTLTPEIPRFGRPLAIMFMDHGSWLRTWSTVRSFPFLSPAHGGTAS
jgi:hypothetical protein